jgi:hypothetical protein
MANSVHQDKQGPVWPLGNIVVAAAGTPVRITSLVDSTAVNAPETPNPGVSGTPPAADEYTTRAQQIIFQALKAGAGPPSLANNTGIVYILKRGAAGGTGNATDKGTIIKALVPGETFILGSAALNRNVYSLYEFFIDADTTGDACQVTAIIQ